MKTSAPSVDLRPDHWAIVRNALRRHVPDREVLAFGSRATWTAKDYSDLDLAVMGEEPLSLRTASALEEALGDSDLPFKVDVVDWAKIDDAFREIIRRNGVVLQGWGQRPEADGFETHSPTIPGRSGMHAEWTRTTLGKLLSFSNGKSSPARSELLPHPVYGSNGVIGFADKSNAGPNTIIIGRVGTYCGSLHYSDSACWVTDNAIRATAIGRNKQSFLRYLLRTLRLNARRTGSGQPLLNQTILSEIPVVVPHPHEQRAIAHILGTLDDKIELNRRMSETLETVARALFRSWFVDFDPVRAKMEGRDTGLQKNIADLFPDRMVDSEMGDIPEGWDAASLGDMAALRRKGADPASEASDTPYIGLADMPRGSIALTAWGEIGSVSSRKSAFKAGDILFGKLRPYFHKVGIAPVDGLCSTDIVVLSAREPRWSSFVLACVSSSAFVAHTSQTATGTKMPRTSWQAMSGYQLCRPTDAIASEFQRIVSPMLGRIVGNVHESRTLATLRDTLLPELISGAIRLPDAERAVESLT